MMKGGHKNTSSGPTNPSEQNRKCYCANPVAFLLQKKKKYSMTQNSNPEGRKIYKEEEERTPVIIIGSILKSMLIDITIH